ncbi:YczE/YyaS/YitT family protein [Aeromicrobium sp. 179-A 4D2 NHS]|uniref:membrane protein YczE n=1 Tax=Aeromicrobium sp. 179-A 4D2 NHS TaxID=3142375 RepID=UPI0039A2B729
MMRRLVQLMLGLWLYGATMAMLVRSGLGLDPWDVFHEGLTHHVPLTFGQVVILVGALVLLLWIPLRQRPGIGTVLNVIVIGLAADATLAVLPDAEHPAVAVLLLAGGVVGNGLAGAMYVGAGLGPGPRDGLWTGIVARTDLSVRAVRTALEVTVVVAGFALGGTIGVGTVVYALAIGPIVQFFLPWFEMRPRVTAPAAA